MMLAEVINGVSEVGMDNFQLPIIGANRPGFGGSVPCPARIVLFT